MEDGSIGFLASEFTPSWAAMSRPEADDRQRWGCLDGLVSTAGLGPGRSQLIKQR